MILRHAVWLKSMLFSAGKLETSPYHQETDHGRERISTEFTCIMTLIAGDFLYTVNCKLSSK